MKELILGRLPDEHDPIYQQWCRLKRRHRRQFFTIAELARIMDPGDLEVFDVFFVDLVKRGVTHPARVVPVGTPLLRTREGRSCQTET